MVHVKVMNAIQFTHYACKFYVTQYLQPVYNYNGV